jgi:hypothetical protein
VRCSARHQRFQRRQDGQRGVRRQPQHDHIAHRAEPRHILTGAAVLLLWIPIRQMPGLGTVSNVIVLGLAATSSALRATSDSSGGRTASVASAASPSTITLLTVTGAAVLLLWIPIRQMPGLGTVSNVIVLGLAADATLAVLPPRSAQSPPPAAHCAPPAIPAAAGRPAWRPPPAPAHATLAVLPPLESLVARSALLVVAIVLNAIATGMYIGRQPQHDHIAHRAEPRHLPDRDP